MSLVSALALLLVLVVPSAAKAEIPKVMQVALGAQTAFEATDFDHDGILTVSDGNLYVQCLSSYIQQRWSCEAAGLRGQSWLHHVLTDERQRNLAELGFRPDPAFGNFIMLLPKTTPRYELALKIVAALRQGYGVKPDDFEINSEVLSGDTCHRRILPDHSMGGLIRTPSLGFDKDTAPDCKPTTGFVSQEYDDPAAVIPAASGIDIDAKYIAAMAVELVRVEKAEKDSHIYAIFATGPAYVQCMHDADDDAMYCEAASDDAVGKPLERILTPERKAMLVEAGFSPPGRVMNYAREYPRAQYDMAAVAKALMNVLRQAYGYQGEPAMTVTTEIAPKRPLIP